MVKTLKPLIVALVFLLSFPANGQQRCVIQGQDTNEYKRTVLTDTAGQLIVDLATGATVAIGGPLGVRAAAGAVSIAPPNNAFFMVSATTAANTAINPMFFQPTDGTGVNVQGKPIYTVVSKDTGANALANPILVQLSDGTNAFLTTTSYPGYWRLQDGAGTELAYIAPATADGLTKSENGLKVEAVMKLDNGASLDSGKSGANKELNVTDVATRPGENYGKNSRDVEIAYLGITQPAKVTTAVDDTALSVTTGTVLFGPTKILPNGRFCVYVKNVGGGAGNALSDVEIYDSPDGVTGWVGTNTWATCDGLVAGTALCKYCSDDPMPWIQIKGRCAGGEDTTAEAHLAQVKR